MGFTLSHATPDDALNRDVYALLLRGADVVVDESAGGYTARVSFRGTEISYTATDRAAALRQAVSVAI